MSSNSEWSDIINYLGEEDLPYGSMVPPIVQTSNFHYKTIAELRKAFSNEWESHLYTRGNNPTVAILRRKLAALEKADDAIIFSSGIASITAAIMSVVSAGDHVICVNHPYSWTSHLLKTYLPKFGVMTSFVNGTSMAEIDGAKNSNTKLLVLESPNSMTFEVQDIRACAAWAKTHNVTTLIDNSYASPLYQNPIEMGIDLVAHSGSKYINGHSDVVCGVLCGSKDLISNIASNEYMTFGSIVHPFEAFLILRGLRTLPLRMEKISRSTKAVFKALKEDNRVESIYFPFDPDNSQYDLARSQMSECPGLMSIRLRSEDESLITAFCESLKYFRMAVSWGGHESLIIPVLAAHQIPGKSVPALPINHIRLYVGLEEPELLINDLRQALNQVS